MKPKKIPMRMCVGCREMKEKKLLIRVVRSPEGEVSLDPGGKKSGRGAYVCKDPECFMNAVRKKGLERSLKCRVDAQVYEGLRSYFEGENS